MRRIIKVESIAIRFVRGNGTLLPTPELQLYVPYSPGNPWFIGSYKMPMRDVFGMGSMFHKIRSS